MTDAKTPRFADARGREGRKRLVVLQSLSAPDGKTRFVDQIVEGASPNVHTEFFTWKTALTSTYDIFHVHWPDLLLNGKSRRARTAKRILFQLLVWRIRLAKIPVVRTLHNLHPHEEATKVDRALMAQLDRSTDLFVRLNPTSPTPPGSSATTILHGHYVERFRQLEAQQSREGCLLYFGLIRPYKGVDLLLDAFARIHESDLTLRIVGKPTEQLRESIEAAASDDPRISHLLHFVDDEVLVREMTGAELVVLPYREMHNSGVALVALSLNRPILVLRTEANEALAQEVGAGWVHFFESSITEVEIREALRQSRSTRDRAAPRLHERDWDYIGRRYYEEYLNLLDPQHRTISSS